MRASVATPDITDIYSIKDISLILRTLSVRDIWVPVLDADRRPIRAWKDNLMVTKLDLSDLRNQNDEDLVRYIRYHTWIDLDFPSWIKLVNERMLQALSIYEQTRWKIVLERRYWSAKNIQDLLPFRDKNEVLAFFRLPENDEGIWKIACFIIKLCYSVHEILSTPGMSNLEDQERKLFQKFSEVIWLAEEESTRWVYKWNYLGQEFIMTGRPKSLISWAEKIIGNPEYMAAEKIKDGIGYTIETAWSDFDVLRMMNGVFELIHSLWGSVDTYDNKWVSIWEITRNPEKFYPDFIDFINTKSVRWAGKKWASSNWYKEIKLLWSIGWVKFEIKFTNKWNQNQNGINFSGVYDYLAKHIEWSVIRQWWLWHITEEEIRMLVDDFFMNIPALLSKNPEKRKTSPEDYLKELWDDLVNLWYVRWGLNFLTQNKTWKLYKYLGPGLSEYYKSKLIKIKLHNGQYTYTSERISRLSREWVIVPLLDTRTWPHKKLKKDVERRKW